MREKRGRRIKPGVGYIGFGNKINVISKTAKIPFSKVKQIYGDELERLSLEKEVGKLSKIEKEKIRKKIKLDIKKVRFKEFILFIFSCILLSILIYLLLVWLFL